MKATEKKKQYRHHVRCQLAGGLVNSDSGNWISSGSLRDDKVKYRAEKIAARMGAKRD